MTTIPITHELRLETEEVLPIQGVEPSHAKGGEGVARPLSSELEELAAWHEHYASQYEQLRASAATPEARNPLSLAINTHRRWEWVARQALAALPSPPGQAS